jgi:hypothetical protein
MSRHQIRLERKPDLDAILSVDGDPKIIVWLRITPDETVVTYEDRPHP